MGRLALVFLILGPAVARAQDALSVQEVRIDPATLHTVGVQALIAGDADRDASAAVRVRPAGGGDADWRVAPPLFRVLPETVAGRAVPEQLSGSVFDLAPGASWEIEIVFSDPDGGGETRTVTATTRPVPRAEPTAPTQVLPRVLAGAGQRRRRHGGRWRRARRGRRGDEPRVGGRRRLRLHGREAPGLGRGLAPGLAARGKPRQEGHPRALSAASP